MPVHPPALPSACLAEILRHAEDGYPEEICGMVIGTPGVPDSVRVRRITNIADREPPPDPAGRPRTARSAYRMDPLEQLQVLRELDAEGGEVLAFYHSHPDHAAYFSAMDRDQALVGGEPIWPGPSYLIVSVIEGRARSACWFTWDPATREFCTDPAAGLAPLAQE
jgi:[CysO sulfur-carrier protein]-S-L-cysteine hydrolase